MSNNLIHIEQASFGYNYNILLKEINVSLSSAEFAILLGANGAGKTTLLKTITGQIPLLSGDIYINKKNIKELSPQEIAVNIAVVTTDRVFSPFIKVYDILALGRTPYVNLFARLKQKDKSVISYYSELLGITSFWKKEFRSLSDGQKQKVLIARALIQDTDIIILDEPTIHLDIKNRMEVFQLLQKIARQKRKTILCVTHEIDIALKFADTVWLIDKHGNFIKGKAEKFNSDTIYCNLF